MAAYDFFVKATPDQLTKWQNAIEACHIGSYMINLSTGEIRLDRHIGRSH